jgi:ribosomal protein S18 acetylase RimI-like enzyme
MELRLIKAEEGRLTDCCKVFLASEIYERYFKEGNRLERSLRTAIEKEELFLAEDEAGSIAGVMRIVMRGFCGLYPYLSLIGVKESFRGKRVGSYLMDQYEAMAQRSGATRVTLMVSDFNKGAQIFYHNRGYWLLGTLKDAVKPGIGELVMVKEME